MGVVARGALRRGLLSVGGQEAVLIGFVAAATEIDLDIVQGPGVGIMTESAIFLHRNPMGIIRFQLVLNFGMAAETEWSLILY